MIFSFQEKPIQKLNFTHLETDIFCHFYSENAVLVPSELWLQAVATTLKMKRNVLILEKNLPAFPSINVTQRWQVGEDFLWIAPRALSVLLEAPIEISKRYKCMKDHLTLSK